MNLDKLTTKIEEEMGSAIDKLQESGELDHSLTLVSRNKINQVRVLLEIFEETMDRQALDFAISDLKKMAL